MSAVFFVLFTALFIHSFYRKFNEMSQSTLPIEPFLIEFAKQSERIIGSIIIKKGVKVSDKTQKNIVISVVSTTTGYNVEFWYRNSLRWVDMGVRPGYVHGIKITVEGYKKALKGKNQGIVKPKKITNRPSFARIHALEDALAVEIEDIAISTIMDQFRAWALDPRIKNALLVRHIQRKDAGANSSKSRKMFEKWA